MTQDSTPIPPLPPRDPDAHKGAFGTVAIVGGCVGGNVGGDVRMIGAPCLSAIAALRAGCGLARLAMPEPILTAGLTIAPSATGVPLAVDDGGALVPHLASQSVDALVGGCGCLAIGPGLSVGPGALAAALRAAGQTRVPIVVDADALNNLALVPQLQQDFHASAVLTPHPGEFARLAPLFAIDADPASQEERPAAAAQLAQRLGVVVVLKGAGTIVSDGARTWTCAARDPALATAGTGDVLTGALASVVAQHGPPGGGMSLYDCARVSVAAHARAARLWREDRRADAGLLAMDLTHHLPDAFASLEGPRS